MNINSFQTSGSSPTTPCRIGLLGCGIVGAAVVRRLAAASAPDSLLLTHVFDRRAATKRDTFPADSPRHARILWTERADDVLTSDVDIVIEAIGGIDEPIGWMEAALRTGKSVVTSNKQAIARHGTALRRLAARQGRQIRFEAAVGGAMPIVRTVGEALAGDRITRIVAILNGTSNAVLSRMEAQQCSLEAALADARSRGYAEADPSADLDGADAAAKLAILCTLAFGLRVEPQEIEARSTAATTVAEVEQRRRAGETVRQLAYAAFDAARSELSAWVAPVPVALGSFFARTIGPQNAAVISGAFAGDILLSGIGAGGEATAVAIIGDLLAIAADKAAIVPAPILSRPNSIRGYTPIDGELASRGGASVRAVAGAHRDRSEALEAL